MDLNRIMHHVGKVVEKRPSRTAPARIIVPWIGSGSE